LISVDFLRGKWYGTTDSPSGRRIKMKRTVLFLVSLLFLFPGMLKAADFDFYGVRFGMTKEAVEKVFKMEDKSGGHEVENPGHYINRIYLGFDHKNRLFYIEAYYLWESIERNYALALALKEKFEDPIKKSYKEIEIKMDTYKDAGGQGTSEYIVMKLTSKPLRSEFIDYLKLDILRKMR
jgi:hypothetical protein